MAYNRTGKITINDKEENFSYSGTSGIAGVNYYSDLDLANNVIFVSPNSSFVVTFSSNTNPDTISVNTNDETLSDNKKNIKGTVRLTHVVSTSEGDTSDNNNTKSLKNTSKPAALITSDSTSQATNDLVHFITSPISNDDRSFEITPTSNLSSNTTYYFLLNDLEAQDYLGSRMSFSVGRGFVTDNSRSIITTNEYYSGFDISSEDSSLPSGKTRGEIEVNDKIKKTLTESSNPFTATVKFIDSVTAKINYELDPETYKLNVAYSGASTCKITSTNHKLSTGDSIEIYDLVSGDDENLLGIHKITYVNGNEFTIPISTISGSGGRLNYFCTLAQNDTIKIDKGNNKIVSKKIEDVTKKSFDLENIPANSRIKLIKDTNDTQIGEQANFIRSVEENQISYIPVESNGKIKSDVFSNNNIFDINVYNSTTEIHENIRFFSKANTNPTHNTNPFNTSAPNVESFSPNSGDPLTSTVKILNISRLEKVVTVLCNNAHNLSAGDSIKISNSDHDTYNNTFTVSKKIDEFTFSFNITTVPNSLPREVSGSEIIKKETSSGSGVYELIYTPFFINFSQSMNTSTITVANNTHIISANGTSAVFTGDENKASSTIQLSYDNFTNLVNCVSITPLSGNSSFRLVPSILNNNNSYKIRVKTDVKDLGDTPPTYQYETQEPLTTGYRSFNPLTNEEIVFEDIEPPLLKKIHMGSGAGTKIIYSDTYSEISNATDLDDVSIDISSTPIVVQFNESMDISTVTVNTDDQTPKGSIQVSCDDFTTVVQMASIVASKTVDENDTFTLTPAGNLSANVEYDIKITSFASDNSPNQNKFATDNVVSIINASYSSEEPAPAVFDENERVIGTRTMTIQTGSLSSSLVSSGFTSGTKFTGDLSSAKGHIFSFTESGGYVTSITYTPIKSDDDSVKNFTPGEQCTIDDTTNTFFIDRSEITKAAEGFVIRHSEGDDRLDIYELSSTKFGNSQRIVGLKNNTYVQTTASGISNSGFSTVTSTALTATAFMRKSDNDIVELNTARTGIDFDSNVIVKFNQTMNIDTLIVNSTDSRVNSSDTVILSADSSFGNCIPLLANPTVSENGTRFEFKPVILSNTSLGLTRGDRYDVKITRGAKNKGGANTASDVTKSYAAIVSTEFISVNASVFDNSGNEVILGTDNSVTHTNISRSTPIIFHFSDAIDISSFSIGAGAGGHLFISTTSNFSSGMIDGTLKKSGRFGTQIIVIPTSTLAVDTFYVKALAGGHNEGGVDNTTQVFGNFTTA